MKGKLRETVVTLTFELTDSSVPARTTAAVAGCRFVLEKVVPHGDGHHVAYYSVDGCDPDRIQAIAAEQTVSDVDVFEDGGSKGLVEVTTTDDFPPIVLASAGAIPRRLVVADGTIRLTVDVPPKDDANGIVTRFEEMYPAGEMVARRQQPHVIPVFNDRGFRLAFAERLTDRQRDVLQAAFQEGYYEWPRRITGEQLGQQLGIAPATLHQHLRTAEQKLLQQVFRESGRRSDEDLVDGLSV